jgi:hypothetical protein
MGEVPITIGRKGAKKSGRKKVIPIKNTLRELT